MKVMPLFPYIVLAFAFSSWHTQDTQQLQNLQAICEMDFKKTLILKKNLTINLLCLASLCNVKCCASHELSKIQA